MTILANIIGGTALAALFVVFYGPIRPGRIRWPGSHAEAGRRYQNGAYTRR